MKVLIACEYSGIVRDAFIVAGHQAVSCDILPSERPGPHIQNDVSLILSGGWGMMIAFPPCTYLAGSGMYWTARGFRDPMLTEKALEFVMMLMDAPIPRIAIENPVGVLSTRIRKPDQIIQPYQFGHDASKRTCLWLKGLPKLIATGPFIEPKIINGKKRWGNQAPCGADRTSPGADRGLKRAKTYQGIADAMASQWRG